MKTQNQNHQQSTPNKEPDTREQRQSTDDDSVQGRQNQRQSRKETENNGNDLAGNASGNTDDVDQPE